MQVFNPNIEDQYHQDSLFEQIINRLHKKGVDLKHVSRDDIKGIDEFHIRGSEVSKELAGEIDLKGLKVLDIGCGIGGPCRMLADDHNCTTIGIDLCYEYVKTARKLSELVGLGHCTSFTQGDALNLPFENKSFDVVWIQHVQMNINDKDKFYSEISRVLNEKGVLLFYEIFRTSDDEIEYPVPWANDPSVSFLDSLTNMNNILTGLGFKKQRLKNQTDIAIQFLNNLFEKTKKHGVPTLGLDVLMGALSNKKLTNLLKGLEEDKIELMSGLYSKH